MKKLESELKVQEPCKLMDCPPGFFLYDGDVCFKSEYGDDEVYCSTGEIFWGGTNNDSKRQNLIVTPTSITYRERQIRKRSK